MLEEIGQKKKILGARITGKDWIKNGLQIKDSIYLTKQLEDIGFDYICVSSGGILPKTNMKFKMGFRMNACKIIKKSSDKINASTVLKKFKKNDSEEYIFKNDIFQIKDTYRLQLKYFIECLKMKQIPMNSFKESLDNLKICLQNEE